tara:strand:- start:45 stop:338 length:294 start_codon:yes stop_codon:yes gene_type:complete
MATDSDNSTDNDNLNRLFIQASNNIKQYTDLTNEELLKLYGLYKQANFGVNTSNKPSIFNYRGLMKWKAWTNERRLTKEEAALEYINMVNKLLNNDT